MTCTLRLSEETRRKWGRFRQNRRGYASLIILVLLLMLCSTGMLVFSYPTSRGAGA